MDETTMKKYELLALFSPELTEKERDEAIRVASDFLKMKGGRIEEEKAWGMRDLAYPIKKHTRGYYHIWHFWQDGVNIAEIERDLSLENSILRHMVTSIKGDEKIVIFAEEEPKKPAKREKGGSQELPKREVKPKKSKPSDKEQEVVEEKLNKIIEGSDISL